MPAAATLEAILKRDRLVVLAGLLALFVLSWAFLLHLAGQMTAMQGMAARMMDMPVRDGISAFLDLAMAPAAAAYADTAVNFVLLALMWLVMMVAMMLPSAAPTVLLFSALERKRTSAARAPARTAIFLSGYFLIWAGFSVAAALLQTLLSRAGLISMQMVTTSAVLGGAIFVAAGLYELTPLKQRCLSHCRSPLDWISRHWRADRAGALRMGLEHGAYCLGCCWVLMLLLFAGGVMNLLWVAILAAAVLIEKLLPAGRVASRVIGTALCAWGVIVLAAPIWRS